MPIVKFVGRISPPTLLIKLRHGPVTSTVPLVGSVTVSCKIVQADITAECDLTNIDDGLLMILHLHVLTMISGIVDAIAFSKGVGVTVVVDHCEKPDGTSGPIGLRDDDLKNACSIGYNDLLALADTEPQILGHIHALVLSVLRPTDAVNCARALEGFRRLLSQGPDKQQWAFMQENLNLSQSYLKFVSDLSRQPRHGSLGAQSFGNIGKTRIHAWNAANRFLEFRKRGNIKLAEVDFPLLK